MTVESGRPSAQPSLLVQRRRADIAALTGKTYLASARREYAVPPSGGDEPADGREAAVD